MTFPHPARVHIVPEPQSRQRTVCPLLPGCVGARTQPPRPRSAAAACQPGPVARPPRSQPIKKGEKQHNLGRDRSVKSPLDSAGTIPLKEPRGGSASATKVHEKQIFLRLRLMKTKQEKSLIRSERRGRLFPGPSRHVLQPASLQSLQASPGGGQRGGREVCLLPSSLRN